MALHLRGLASNDSRASFEHLPPGDAGDVRRRMDRFRESPLGSAAIIGGDVEAPEKRTGFL